MTVIETNTASCNPQLAGCIAVVGIMALLYATYRYMKSLDDINHHQCPKCGGANRHECEYYGCYRETDL